MKTISISYVIANTKLGNLRELLKLLVNKSIERGFLQLNHRITASAQNIYFAEQTQVISFKISQLDYKSSPENEIEHQKFLFNSILKLLTQTLEAHCIPINMDPISSPENHHLILYTDDEYLTLHLNDENITFTYYYTNE